MIILFALYSAKCAVKKNHNNNLNVSFMPRWVTGTLSLLSGLSTLDYQ